MRKAFFFSLAVTIVFLLSAMAADEAATTVISVKGSQKSSGVITLQITKDSKSYELNCNESMPSCVDLKKGTYRMVELPKNHGMYDCQNVRVFAESAVSTDDDAKLGEYCLAAQ